MFDVVTFGSATRDIFARSKEYKIIDSTGVELGSLPVGSEISLNFNPANKKLIELFDQNYFGNKELFSRSISILDQFFQKEKKFGRQSKWRLWEILV